MDARVASTDYKVYNSPICKQRKSSEFLNISLLYYVLGLAMGWVHSEPSILSNPLTNS